MSTASHETHTIVFVHSVYTQVLYSTLYVVWCREVCSYDDVIYMHMNFSRAV